MTNSTALFLSPHQIHVQTPFNPMTSVGLIEASAGTGKTYQIVSIYLNLLLEGINGTPLRGRDILVVTFTEAATQELKGRIRERLHQTTQILYLYSKTGEDALLEPLTEVVRNYVVKNGAEAVLRCFTQAINEIDMAAVFTIHGFCQRMLSQYAFHSRVHFNFELIKDEALLLERLSNEVWREHFYACSETVATFIYRHFVSPQYLANMINIPQLLAKENIVIESQQSALLELSFDEFITYLERQQTECVAAIHHLKQQWLHYQADIEGLIWAELEFKYKKGEKKRLNRRSFSSKNTATWLTDIATWANNPTEMTLPERLLSHFSQQALATKYKEEGAEGEISHSVFTLVDKFIAQFPIEQERLNYKLLLWHYIQALRTKVIAHKLNNVEKGFDDLLRLLDEALLSDQGEALAALIRHQYPFAMIDEFQDTDARQYSIFSTIYIKNKTENTGFLMIGDPKQAIYKFRGADIFTYLYAAQQVQWRSHLSTNWRSSAEVIGAVNHLFSLPKQPFLSEQIQFQPVEAAQNKVSTMPAIKFHLMAEEEDLARICAYEIQQWIKMGKVNLAQSPNDVAVLVRSKTQADLVRNALQEVGIGSVYLSDKTNVFTTQEAQDLYLLLQACLDPLNERAISNAISTALFSFTSAELVQLRQSEMAWDKMVEQFISYQRQWHYDGVLVMLYHLFHQHHIAKRLLAEIDGERRLTDLLHLVELLQQASVLNESESALVHWFELQLKNEHYNADEYQIRLESERNLVKVVTYHKSKGLEYNFVWLPFLTKLEGQDNKDVVALYHAENKLLWDIEDQHSEQVMQEQFAESMRLLYVALTRAKSHISIAAVPNLHLNKKWNALLYLLTKGELGEELVEGDYSLTDLLVEFKQGLPENWVEIEHIEQVEQDPWRANIVNSEPLHYAVFNKNIESNWEVSSFTALERLHQRNQRKTLLAKENVVFDEAKDTDMVAEMQAFQQEIAEPNEPLPNNQFYLQGGIKLGDRLHHYFESHSFALANVESEVIQKLCADLQLDKNWQQPMTEWLNNIVSTPLLVDEPLRLIDLKEKDCLKEMEFYLKLDRTFSIKKFNQLLKQHHTLMTEDWLFNDIQGVIRGFIDLVFRHNGKYYILDYKSNYLGHSFSDYAPAQLKQAMQAYHYDLQYLIYSVALHRYLTIRDPHYQYESHFGGIFYTFLRGMNGQNNEYGIFFDRPNPELILGLDSLFAGA